MDKPVIGLTGPIGSGKSTVASFLKKSGCAVIDADQLSREAALNPECLAKLKETFGADITGADGALDRRLLAQRAFSTHENAERLNAITHPVILAEAEKRIAEAKAGSVKAVVLEAILLFESGADRLCDVCVAVTAPDSVRLHRVIKRDGSSEDAARARMNNQHEAAFYTERASYSFDGSAAWDELPAKAAELLETILRDLHGKK